MSHLSKPNRGSRGFTMIELLVVVAIIIILAALVLPNIAGFLRNYKIRGAAQNVAGEIQSARSKAVTKNVNLGVVFVTLDSTRYQWVIEDDQNPTNGVSPIRQPMSSLLTQNVPVGPVRLLPAGLQFTQSCPSTPSGGDWDPGLRFNRLGAWCKPGSNANSCPDPAGGAHFC